MLKSVAKVGLVAAIVTAIAFTMTSGSAAGDLYDGRGSIKDAPMMRAQPAAGRCYVRGDVGYSVSGRPSAEINSPHYGVLESSHEGMDGGFMGEVGIGCGSGSRGFRADLTLGYRGERDIVGTKAAAPGIHDAGTFSSKVSTLTAMANVYYDFGKFRSFVPYVGVGLGVGRHNLSDVSFAFANPAAPSGNNLNGASQTNFAWSLMAGVGYQISHRAVLDLGYRYIDMGSVSSNRGDMCNCAGGRGSRDRIEVNDMTAHEFKVGLRYHFGGSRAVQSFK